MIETGVHRIGVIGIGIMGCRMVDAMRFHPAFSVIAGYDPSPDARCPGLSIVSDAADLINDPAIDCVYVASPPATHLGFVEAAIAARKSVFCEKPLAVSPKEAAACVGAADRSRLPCAVNFPFATAPAAIRLNELVETGALGTIEQARLTLRFRRWPRGWQSGAGGWLARPEQGGFLREVGSHFIFLAQRIFGQGRPSTVQIERGPAGTEERVLATIAYGAILLTIDAAIAGDLDDYNRLDVIGDRDRASLTDWYRLEYGGTVGEREPPTSSQLDHLALMLSGQSHSLATFAEACTVVEIVERLLARAT